MIGEFYDCNGPARRGAAVEDTIKAQLIEGSDFQRTGIAGFRSCRYINNSPDIHTGTAVLRIDGHTAAVARQACGSGFGPGAGIKNGRCVRNDADLARLPAFGGVGGDRALL